MSLEIKELLAELAASGEPERLRQALDHPDERVRAAAARGLHRLKAADALEAALATLSDAPDLLHQEQTPAVQTLVDLGREGFAALFPLLLHPDEWTRRLAQAVLQQSSYRLVQSELDPADRHLVRDHWQSLWEENGAYDWRAGRTARIASVVRWRRWLENIATI